MAVTFKDKEEAKEYQRSKLSEGIETYLLAKDDEFEVRILGKVSNRKIKFEKVPREWLSNKTNLGEYGDEEQYTDEYSGEYKGKATAWYTKKANTRMKLHELGHAKLGHMQYLEKDAIISARKIAKDEIEAEIYSYEKMGR